MASKTAGNKTARRWVQVLLIAPFIGTLWVPFYNTKAPTFQGIPFFYWYLFLWVIVSAIITAIVYAINPG